MSEDQAVWEKGAFVATPGNLPLTRIPNLVHTLWIQVAWGGMAQPIIYDENWLQAARDLGYRLAAWAWVQGPDLEREAGLHAVCAQGFDAFCANMEEPLDAHGDSSHPKFGMPGEYLAALNWDGPLAVTTTPLFGSDMTAWIAAGAITMPQSFPLENHVGFSQAVAHARAWGWPEEAIRPLVQSYPSPQGQRPDPVALNAEATHLGLGATPYTLEQALDDAGVAWLETMRPSIERPQKQAPEPPDGGDDIVAQLIGNQDGVKAYFEWLREQPNVPQRGPKYDPDDIATWPWPDKLERSLQIVVDDHDELTNKLSAEQELTQE